MSKFPQDRVASLAALEGTTRRDGEACEEEFAALVGRRAQFVFRVAFAIVRNVQDAEDVVQETFLKLYRNRSWLKIKDEKAFLARVAWRIAVDRASRLSHCRLEQDKADAGLSAENELMKADLEGALRCFMDSLPAELRVPLALSSIEEMKSPEIARAMGIPEGTVRTRIARARTILKQKLMQWEVRRG